MTGANAPLYFTPAESASGHPGYQKNVFSIVDYYLGQGIAASKLILSVPFYGRGYVLQNSADNGYYCDATAAGPQGYWLMSDAGTGVLSYMEIQQESAVNGSKWATAQEEPCYWTKHTYSTSGPDYLW